MTSNRRFLDEPEDPTFMEVTQAAFRQVNTIGSVIGYGPEDSREDSRSERFNPFEGDNLTGYEDHADRFKHVYSRDAFEAEKAKIDKEQRDRDVIDAAGTRGLALSLAAGVLDPINLVPLGTIIKSAKFGESVLRSAGKVGLSGTVAATASEAVLQGTQSLRSVEESAFAITGATLLSGIIGGVGGAVYFRNFHKVAKKLEQDLLEDGLDLSVGAASVMGPREEMLPKVALGLKGKDAMNLLTMGPGARLEVSRFRAAIDAARKLESNPSIQRQNAQGVPSPQATEDFIRLWEANYGQATMDLDRAFFKFRKGFDTNSVARMKLNDWTAFKDMTKSEFNEQVGIAMRNGDTHAIPEVAEAAKSWRKNFYEPVMKSAIEAKLLPEDFAGVDPITAVSYLNRRYNVKKIRDNRQAFEGVIVDWLKKGGSRSEEIARAKDTQALEKSLAKLKVSDETELRAVAEEIIENITNFGRMELPSAGASVFHKRAFLIPDNFIQDYLESDIELLASSIQNHVIPRIEIAKQFGDPSMKQAIEAITEEARALIRANPQYTAKIERELKNDIRDLEAIRDRLLGVYKAPEDPDAFIPRASLVIRQQNYVSMLGQMTLSSIADIGKPMMNAGLKRYSQGLAALALSPKKFKLAAAEAKLAGLAWDMVLHSRAKSLYEIGDPYGQLSKVERTSKAMANSFGLATLMDPWNAVMRQFSSVLISDRIVGASEKLAAGKISKADLERLSASGISEAMAARIAKEYAKHGESVTGLRIARTDLWQDKAAVKAFRAALVKDVNNTIVMPGKGDSPLWMSSELGKHVTQFQSFSISSVRRTLQTGLQTRDMATLNGVLLMLAAGSASYATKQTFKGEEVDTDNIIMEAIDQSGLFGYLWEVPQMVNRATGDSMWQSSQRYKNRPDITSLMGPTASQGTRVLKIAGKAISDQEFDEKNFRKLVPYQNLFYLRWLFDEAEAGMAD